MKKALAFVKPLSKFVAVLAVLSSCAKTNYDGPARLRPFGDQTATPQGTGQQQGRTDGTNGGARGGDPVGPNNDLPLIVAPRAGVVRQIGVAVGQAVGNGELLCVIDEGE